MFMRKSRISLARQYPNQEGIIFVFQQNSTTRNEKMNIEAIAITREDDRHVYV